MVGGKVSVTQFAHIVSIAIEYTNMKTEAVTHESNIVNTVGRIGLVSSTRSSGVHFACVQELPSDVQVLFVQVPFANLHAVSHELHVRGQAIAIVCPAGIAGFKE